MEFRWQGRGPKEIEGNLAQLDLRTKNQIKAIFEYQAARSTGYMKTTAPWTDQTSAARNGLHATASFPPGAFELVLAHAVSYGIWLEVCNSGRYQVILPSLRAAITDLQQLIDGLWEHL